MVMSTARTHDAKKSPKPAHTAPPPSVRKNQADVYIDVERLSLHGYTQPQQQRFVQALETALSQLAMDRKEWSLLTSRHIEDVAPLRPLPGATPEAAARQLARQLFGLLDKQDSERSHG
jgi:hypothetical protein